MSKPNDADIENRHRHHAPDERAARKHAAVREATEGCAKFIRDTCPPGRELALALTKMDEARMWANAAIACNADRDVSS